MLSLFFSFSNLAEWTPMTTSWLAYFFSSLAMSGIVWMQLMQQRVQKSSRTILPFKSASLIGAPVLSQATPPDSSGAGSRKVVEPFAAFALASGWAEAGGGPETA